jgi:hypothetical protein
MEISMEMHQNLKVQPTYEPTVSLWGIYPQLCESVYNQTISTHMLITALFTIAKIWNQTRCPATHEYIKKMWYTVNVVLFSHKEE